MTADLKTPASPRTVLLISDQFDDEDGPGAHAHAYGAHLPALGWRVLVVTSGERANDSRSKALEVHHLAPGSVIGTAARFLPIRGCSGSQTPDALGWGRRAAARAVALAKVRGADVVLSSAPSHLATLAGWYAMRRLDLPWVAELHDETAGEPPSRSPRSWVSYARLTDAALRQATTLVTADATVQSVRNRFAGIPISQIDPAEGGVAVQAMDAVLREAMRRTAMAPKQRPEDLSRSR